MLYGSFNLPSSGAIIRKKSYLDFPTVGNPNNVYIDTTKQVIYRWDNENSKYEKDTQDFSDVVRIDGGTANG